MLNAWIVTLREAAEVLLITAAAQAYLRQQGRAQLLGQLVWGLLLGTALGVLIAAWAVSAPLDPRLEAAITIAFALSITLVATGMLSSADAVHRRVQLIIDAWFERAAVPVVVITFGAIVALRETLETALFLRSLQLRTGSSEIFTGAVLGLATAAFLAQGYGYLRTRVKLLVLFRVSTLLLLLLSIRLLLKGVSDLLRMQGPAFENLDPFLCGGPWFGWLCAALMSVPLYVLLKKWWHESASGPRL